ncbi:DUF6046 domain-containing protein [Chryseobacterium carnipullorum]|uniref:DUF6046 domain-containing protein n=1 Tax=Chryseobacterium carnipullorum TaxID=1124835 RepID=UPI000E98BDA8|nr:DUF6046 domain-containing protein [Chryseobacterium carnipullorum]HBV14943.1 hypothetical protein [Chryseobacterium carnipullorum]
MSLTTANVINLIPLYKEVFGKNPFFIDDSGKTKQFTDTTKYGDLPRNPRPKGTIHVSSKGQSFNKIGAYGQDVWFPVVFSAKELVTGENGNLISEDISVEIDICTTSVNLVKTIVRTPVVERKGSVIEIVDIENPKFTIRGFLIGKNRTVPEKDIVNLQKLFESSRSIELHGGYVELFLNKSCKVVISDLEFPEVQGFNHYIRPFTIICEADFIDDLESPLSAP